MYAVIEAGGHQYKVSQGDEIRVDLQAGKEGDKIKFDRVLMLGGGKVVIGDPVVKGAAVEAVIKQQVRDPKVTIFKYRRRKGYKKMFGHRQPVTVVTISKISQ